MRKKALGVRCVAAPIRNAQGYPTAAISISGAVLSMQEDQFFQYADFLTNACRALASNANEFPAGQMLLLKQIKENSENE